MTDRLLVRNGLLTDSTFNRRVRMAVAIHLSGYALILSGGVGVEVARTGTTPHLVSWAVLIGGFLMSAAAGLFVALSVWHRRRSAHAAPPRLRPP